MMKSIPNFFLSKLGYSSSSTTLASFSVFSIEDNRVPTLFNTVVPPIDKSLEVYQVKISWRTTRMMRIY